MFTAAAGAVVVVVAAAAAVLQHHLQVDPYRQMQKLVAWVV